MNDTSNPIEHPGYIPATMKEASLAYQVLCEQKARLTTMDKAIFLNGWFAIHFVGVAPHPDDLEDWPPAIKPFAIEAWRRYEAGELSEDEIYCSSAQREGIRLQLHGNTECHVVGTLGKHTGYMAGTFDARVGVKPHLTGNHDKASVYKSAKEADKACEAIRLDHLEVREGRPGNDTDCPELQPIPLEEDIRVVIRSEHGLYLYRDGRTFGPNPVRACKYRLREDRVEEQLRQVVRETGYRWTWVDYRQLMSTNAKEVRNECGIY